MSEQSWAQVAVAVVLSLVPACAQVRMAGFDNTTGVVRYCGNPYTRMEEIQAAARGQCKKERRLEVLRCMDEPAGASAWTSSSAAGSSVTRIEPQYGTCCDFRCVPPS